MIEKISKFEKKIQIKMKDKSLLIKALTHKSANQVYNNEKLEFLGDRVLGLVLSNKLIDLYPNENEGILDKRFAKLVNRSTCSMMGWSIQMQEYIILGDAKKKVTQKDEKILSDSCEALIGAIFLDQGFYFAQEFVLKLWKKHIDKSYITVLDSKTKLQEYSLKIYKKLPIYRLINSSGPRHNPIFKISVSIHGSKLYIGTGSSKQDAQQDAAKKLLKNITIT
jgi:ribonuclease-3